MFSGALSVKQGLVVNVDSLRWTCTVKFDDGTPMEDIPISPIYLNKGGQGIYYVPEVDAMVLVGRVKDKNFLLGMNYPIDVEKDIEEAEAIRSPKDVAPDHSAKRPILNPGDIALSTRGGSSIIMRGGGVLEIGAGDTAKRFYIPIGDIVRDLCFSYDLQTAAGLFSLLTREGDERHGTVSAEVSINPRDPNDIPQTVEITKSPTTVKLHVKEFAEDDVPVFKLDIGRIENEDGNDAPLPYSPAKSFDLSSLLRLNLNDKVTLFMDKFGTVVHTVSGTVSKSYGSDLNIGVKGNKKETVLGEEKTTVGARALKVRGADSKIIGGISEEDYAKSRRITSRGKVTSIVEGLLEETLGSFNRKILGGSKELITGDRSQTIAGNRILSIGEKSQDLITKGEDRTIVSGGSLTKVLKDDLKYTIYSGKAEIEFLGISKLVIDKNKALLKYLEVAVVDANKTGVGIFSAGSGIEVGQSSIIIGSKAGPLGSVITTKTHPVCFVTGIPILGAANVGVRSVAPSPVASPTGYSRG